MRLTGLELVCILINTGWSGGVIPVPESLLHPLATDFTHLSNGGATNPSLRSLHATQLPIIGLNAYAEAGRLYADIQSGLRYILETNNTYTLALHGTGMTGMTAVFDNLVERGDNVLVCSSEHWGFVGADVAERLGANVTRIFHGVKSFNLSTVEEALETHKPKILFMVNGDSSNGIYQPLEGIGQLCQKHNCLTVIDVVSTLGAIPIKMDENKLDAVFSSSQKGIGGIVGMAVVSFSPRAVGVIKSRKTPPVVRMTDMLSQAKVWRIEKAIGTEITPHTQSFPLLYMVREALANIAEEGVENVWRRHELSSRAFYEGVTRIGMHLLAPPDEEVLIATIVCKVPEGKDAFKIAAYALENYRVDIMPGFAARRGKAIRVGLFANNAHVEIAEKVLRALSAAIRSPETDVALVSP